MGEVYTYAGTHLTTVREDTAEFRQLAELGQVGGGSFTIHDEAGTVSIVGQKDFSHTESSCSTPLTFRGYVADRRYTREADPKVSAGRSIVVDLVDTNAMLGFRLIYQKAGLTPAQGGNRPAETVAARAAWLLASSFVSGLFSDLGRCTFSSTVTMDKADYRYQYPGDVLADMALAVGGGINYHVNDYGSGPELVFRNDNTSSADSSTLRISNVLSDASGVTLHPFKDAVLTRSPADVYSKVAYSYANGTVVEERTATATAFNGERSGTASNANVKTADMASDQAVSILAQHSTEKDTIECTVLATSAQVNLMPPGYRIQAKFSHLNTEGYGSFAWFRILEVVKKPIVADGALYEVRLRLSPQETLPVASSCSDLYANTASATFYPLGGSGNTPNVTPSPGVVYYFRPGIAEPYVPTVGYAGKWHFPAYSAGGLGTIDYAGDCVQNWLILMTVGNGTWTIQTERWAGTVRTLSVYKGATFNSGTLQSTISSGDSVVVTISDATAGDCIRVVAITDSSWPTCGSKWGWSQAAWVAAP